MKNECKILIVDDHQMIRDLIGFMLDGREEYSIVGKVSSLEEAEQVLSKQKVDVCILDLSLGEGDGLELLRASYKDRPEIKFLILSMYANPSNIQQSIKLGAKGFLPKDASGEELMRGIEDVANGKKYYSPKIIETLIGDWTPEPPKGGLIDKINQLTRREKEILSAVVEGKSNHDIADLYGISKRTAENHRSRILKKTGARSFMELARVVMENRMELV
ncbi:DNA-binding NarL/FixJ family response regulator [Catalinimonas alkaloidigena]|uniref:response regulator transcription factor n=1 Tax=Catalinimonas alkaloidigena TaxID=1075417 RepID=UPI0024062D6A|nr:response regulator transcription factor [Catalinimonas alkaloidigena]MDF9798147.1 DNA-binding NarL/FixJ family response regulator [Catalinimonas alkaloidigena]